MRLALLFLAMIALGILIWSLPARSQERPCISPEVVAKYVQQQKGVINGGAVYNGVYADSTLIYTMGGVVRFLSFKGGCAIGPAGNLDLDRNAPRERPAVKGTPA